MYVWMDGCVCVCCSLYLINDNYFIVLFLYSILRVVNKNAPLIPVLAFLYIFSYELHAWSFNIFWMYTIYLIIIIYCLKFLLRKPFINQKL